MNGLIARLLPTLTVAALFLPHHADADILLPKVFCDYMVLQRDSVIPIAGTAEPSQALRVTFNKQTLPVTADDQGNWAVDLPVGQAGGPHQLEIVATDSEAKVVIHDVMVGDVWLCAGQSNMAWPVSQAANAEAELEQSAEQTMLRLFRVEESVSAQREAEFAKVEPWQVCSPETVKDFSATAYFFGRAISQQVPKVPVGLMTAAVGGTPCEAWLSMERLKSIDPLKPLLDHWESNEELNSTHRPANLYNAMIAPLGKFPIRGVIWYQGEANVGRAAQYRQMFPALIQDWRTLFGKPDLPFYYAQLAPYRYETMTPESLPELWEAQLQTLRVVPHTGMAVLTDVGDAADIHPKNKQEVGRRLARLALANVYKNELAEQEPYVDAMGPIFESATNGDDRIRIKFTGCNSGLKVAGDGDTLAGFTICGEDQQFYPATAAIVDGLVEVRSDEVPHPKAVRFGWQDTAPMNLVNGEGLPASPFRTDDFPASSETRDF